jgi:hypothetical protein
LSYRVGDTVVYPYEFTRNGVRLRYGAFVLKGNTPDRSAHLDVVGTVNKKRVKGTFSVYVLYNENGQQDANGSIRCDSGDLFYRARRVRRR